jgi:hypothetical protein
MTLKKLFQHKDVYINQELENIVRNAQSKDFTISKTLPSDRDGIDGEIRIFNPQPDYVSFLIKLNGKWFEFSLNKIITNFVAGKGISISQDNNPIISNTGVLSLNSLSGDILLQGTSNQINVNTLGNNIILSTPQDIHTGATPTFAGLYLSNLTPGSVLFAGQNGLISQNPGRLYWDNVNELLGVGTNILKFRLNVSGGIFAKGNVSQGETLGNIGSGAFMIFYPRKGAFRAGAVYNNQWDDNNIGFFSFAGGADTIASGTYSVALGYGNTASNDSSVALGFNNTASGQQSFAVGLINTASGNRAVALGHQNTASGNGSVALGYQSYASSFGSVALGVSAQASGYSSVAIGNFNNAIGSDSVALGFGTKANSMFSIALGTYNVGFGNPTSWVDTDPILEVGIGTSDSNRLNAITILKNGKVGVGTTIPSEKFEILGKLSLQDITLNTTNRAKLWYEEDVNSIGYSYFYYGHRWHSNLYFQSNSNAGVKTFAKLTSLGWSGGGAILSLYDYNGNEKILLTTTGNSYFNAGNVGIGTTNPSQKLTVAGNIGIQAGTDAFIGTLDNYNLILRTNNTNRIYITSNGRVGIETNPNDYNSKFAVVDNANINNDIRVITGFTPNLNVNYGVWLGLGKSLATCNSGWIFFKYVGDQSTNNFLSFGLYNVDNVLVIRGNGNVGIRNTSPTYALQIGAAGDGTSAIANAWNTYSDIRLKEVVGEVKSDEALEKILSLQAKRFCYKNDESKREYVGFIAQEVEEYIPEVISTDSSEEQYKAIAYEKIIPFLVEAVKQLYQELQEVKQWIKNKN